MEQWRHLSSRRAASPLNHQPGAIAIKTTSSTRRLLGFTIPCAVLALLLSSAPAGVVTNTNDAGPGSLRQAIADAASGDTITFDAPLSGQTIVLTSGQLTVDKDLVIDASGLAGGITVDGNEASRIFQFTSGTSTLTSLTLVNRSPQNGWGGGIYNSSTLTVNNCTLSGNSAILGGGISNVGTLAIIGCTLDSNSAILMGGGVCNWGGTLTIYRSTFDDNSAISGGAVSSISMHGGLTINHSILTNNAASVGGGITNGGTLTLNDSALHDNSAQDGGGIFNSGTLRAYNSVFSGNTAEGVTNGVPDHSGNGGGIYDARHHTE